MKSEQLFEVMGYRETLNKIVGLAAGIGYTIEGREPVLQIDIDKMILGFRAIKDIAKEGLEGKTVDVEKVEVNSEFMQELEKMDEQNGKA